MRKGLVRSLIAVAWLALMGWLVRYEAFPQRFTRTLEGYDGLLGQDTLITEQWMRVLQDGKSVGYTFSSVDIDDTSRKRHIVFENRTQVRREVMGHTIRIRAQGTAYLDAGYRLQAFEFSVDADPLRLAVEGTRSEGEIFDIDLVSAGVTNRSRIEIPDRVILHSPMTRLAVQRLREGETFTVETLNPITLAREGVTLLAEAYETLVIDDVEYAATRLAITYLGQTTRAWVDSEGALLRQETGMGWTLERCDADDVFDDNAQQESPHPTTRSTVSPGPGRGDAHHHS